MKIGRDAWLAIGLLLVLILVTLAAALQENQRAELPPLASNSSDPWGARALRLWLEQLGYEVLAEDASLYPIPSEASGALILEPMTSIAEEEWVRMDAWVEDGGVLVLAGEKLATQFALQHFEFSLRWLRQPVAELVVQTPMLRSPPMTGPASVGASTYLQTDRQDFVTLIASEGYPILVTFQQGDGRVFLSSTAFPFSNAGLKKDGNPSLVLNIISAAGADASIWFDEWHHGFRSQSSQISGAESWLRRTAVGRALLYVSAVIFFSLLLRGQRFGRAVPLAKTSLRRAPMEYLSAIANLSRRAGHRSAILRRYAHWLKRSLGARAHLAPTLEDDVFVDRLHQYDPELDHLALRNLLGRLRKGNVTEAGMFQLGVEVAKWMAAKKAR